MATFKGDASVVSRSLGRRYEAANCESLKQNRALKVQKTMLNVMGGVCFLRGCDVFEVNRDVRVHAIQLQ